VAIAPVVAARRRGRPGDRDRSRCSDPGRRSRGLAPAFGRSGGWALPTSVPLPRLPPGEPLGSSNGKRGRGRTMRAPCTWASTSRPTPMSPRIRGRLRHIVIPVTVAAILAAVLSPLVGYLERRRVSCAAGSVLVFVLNVVLGLAFGVLILTGISSQSGSLTGHLQDASDEIQGLARGPGRQCAHRPERQGRCELVCQRRLPRAHRRPRDRHQRARVAGGVPRFHRAQPLLPGQGRATDQGLGRAPSRRSRSRGEHDR
jgi:hypothetical protein